MTRILHLSDLHFGRARPELETPLLAAIERAAPDLVVISGDFTQRARRGQFRQAQDFLAGIAAPVLSVPGNHDTPLDNPVLRFLAPFARYRRRISAETEPVFRDASMVVAGVNTVNPWAWQQGRFRRKARDRICRLFDGLAPGVLRVVALHHPLEHGPGVDKKPMRGAHAALETLSECGADVVLSGHLHRAASDPHAAAPGLLLVQAGTGLSTRKRGEENTFNLLDWQAGRDLCLTTWAAADDADGPSFAPGPGARFRREAGAWHRLTTTAPDA